MAINLDLVGLNTLITEPIDGSTNTIGEPPSTATRAIENPSNSSMRSGFNCSAVTSNYGTTGPLSIAFWFKLDGISTSERWVLHAEDAGGNDSIKVYFHSNEIRVYIYDTSSGFERIDYAYTMDTGGRWDHIVFSWDGLMNTSFAPVLYLNGAVESGTVVTTTSASDTRNDIVELTVFEEATNSSGNELQGSLQHLSFFNTALTADQAAEIYSSGRSRSLEHISTVANIIDYWRLGAEDVLSDLAVGAALAEDLELGATIGSSVLTNEDTDLVISEGPEGIPDYVNTKLALIPKDTYFAALNIHRNSIYNFPIFKQTRISENPLTRHHNKNSIFSYAPDTGALKQVFIGTRLHSTFRERRGELRHITESVVTSNHKPITLVGAVNRTNAAGEVVKERVELLTSFGNETQYFGNNAANRNFDLEYDTVVGYEELSDLYLGGALNSDQSPIDEFELMNYSQTIFPKSENSYLNQVRSRTNYSSFWKDSRSERTQTNVSNGFGVTVLSQSSWPLDPSEFFDAGIQNIFYAHTSPVLGTAVDATTLGGNGILTVSYNQVSIANSANVNLDGFISASCQYARASVESSITASHNPHGITHNFGQNDTSILNVYGTGMAKWEAGSQAGKNPFYNSYSDYAELIRVFGKDHSIIPEYKMSNFVEELLTKGPVSPDNLTTPLLDMVGAPADYDTSNESNFFEIYSTTDFLKNFELIQEDHDGFVNPMSLTLRCKGIKKFLPYEGFYPCQRTVTIAQQFYNDIKDQVEFQSDGASVDLTVAGNTSAPQAIVAPLFAPGLLYNTIKSGIAVDFPLIGDYNNELHYSYTTSYSNALSKVFTTYNEPDGYIGMFDFAFKERVPFEALVDPGTYLSDRFIDFSSDMAIYSREAKTKWSGRTSDNYSKMINNFLAETADFFLENENYTTITSLPEGDPNFGNAVAGKTYMMRLKMYRSITGSKPMITASNGIEFVPPQDLGEMRENFTMYTRPTAFGIPSRLTLASTETPSSGLGRREVNFKNWADFKFEGSEDFSYATGTYSTAEIYDENLSDLVTAGNHTLVGNQPEKGYNYPFTPPYYHGEAWADFTFTAADSKKYSLDEIINSSSVEFYRYWDTPLTASTHSGSGTEVLVPHYRLINEEACQIASSVNIRSKGITNRVDSLSVSDSYRWIMQSKYETPMLNFNHLTFNDITLPSVATGSATIGMWHQYGQLPQTSSQGVFMEIGDVPKEWIQGPMTGDINRTGSLSELCGFETTPVRIGEIKEAKLIKEAVVAVPFIEREGKRKFFKIPRIDVEHAMDPKTRNLVGRTVNDMVDNMREFIFPPSMDFVRNKNLEPFSMYIFVFEHKLTKQDLSDIWQNLPPSIGISHETAEATVSHELLYHELLGPGALLKTGQNNELELERRARYDNIPSDVRWMVFKVKQRAASSYNDKMFTYKDSSSQRGQRQQDREDTSDIQYNWPYDFFSLVELIKIDAEIDFAKPSSNPDADGSTVEPLVKGAVSSATGKTSRKQNIKGKK